MKIIQSYQLFISKLDFENAYFLREFFEKEGISLHDPDPKNESILSFNLTCEFGNDVALELKAVCQNPEPEDSEFEIAVRKNIFNMLPSFEHMLSVKAKKEN